MHKLYKTDTVYAILLGTLLALASSIVVPYIRLYVAAPYLDEIYHIPQAQHYCDGNFSVWNSKITTLPGLYIVSYCIFYLLSLLTNSSTLMLCSTDSLRMVNYVFSCLNASVIYLLLREIHKNDMRNLTHLIYSLTLAAFPVLYFFTFLYYTDQGSTFFVLLGILSSKKGWHSLSGILYSIAILFRQTNIVWLLFSAGTQLLFSVEKRIQADLSIFYKIFRAVLYSLLQLKPTAKLLIPYCTVLMFFVVFLIWNDGIVVGDRSQHEASIHLCQLLYFLFITCIFIWPHCIAMLKAISLSDFRLSRLILIAMLTILFLAFVYFSSIAHPYLLADNRHYPFYFWRKIINYSPLTRYYLAIIYSISAIFITKLLLEKQTALWCIIYFICLFLVLVPQSLVEFRYYILPYLIFRLHCRVPDLSTLLPEFLTVLAINAITIYVFFSKEFYWQDSEQVQRILW